MGVSRAQGPRSEPPSSGLGWLSPGIPAFQVTVHLPWQVDEQMHACYAQTMSEWLGCEAIVRQRERESHAAALAKCSSGASLDSHLHRMMHRDSTISNEVMGGPPQGAGGGALLHQAVVGRVRPGCLGPWDRVSPLAFGWKVTLESDRPDFKLQPLRFLALGLRQAPLLLGLSFLIYEVGMIICTGEICVQLKQASINKVPSTVLDFHLFSKCC